MRLVPCPFCKQKEDGLSYDKWYGWYRVHCWNCKTIGPRARSENEARIAWNKSKEVKNAGN